jgi:hypothetical protein
MTQVPSSPTTSPSANTAQYGDLLRAVEGLRNWRAVFLSIIFLSVALLLTFLGGLLGFKLSSVVVSMIFSLLAALVAYCGFSAVGLTLMDQAQGLPQRPLALVIVDSANAALRILTVALIGLVVVLIFNALMAVILFVCKIPALGPVLYAVAFPILVVVGGLLLFSIVVAFSMTGPVVWSGASLRGTLAMLWQITTKRTVELLISLVLLSLLSALVGYIVFAILGSGFFSVVSLSATILDFRASVSLLNPLGLFSGSSGFGGSSDGASYLAAAGFGSAILLVLVFSALNAMVLMGLNLIYLKLSADLDPSETERLIGQRLAEAREKAQALKEESQRRLEEARELRRQQQEAAAAQAQAAAQAAAAQAAAVAAAQAQAVAQAQAAQTQAAPVTPAASVASAQPAAALCPKCQAPIIPGDLFCGECGHKLG